MLETQQLQAWGNALILLSLCAFLQHGIIQGETQSDLEKCAIIIKSSKLQENLLTDRSLKNSNSKDQTWKKSNSECETREKNRVQTPEITRELMGQQWSSSSLFHQTWSCLLFQGENLHLASDQPSRIVSSVCFAAKGTQQAFFLRVILHILENFMKTCTNTSLSCARSLIIASLCAAYRKVRLPDLQRSAWPIFAALESLEKCLHST